MSKLGFTVIQTSGEDVEYPASELNTHSPHTKGWQSPRFCEFPQELGLQLAHRSQLTQLQLLSHQHNYVAPILCSLEAVQRGRTSRHWTKKPHAHISRGR